MAMLKDRDRLRENEQKRKRYQQDKLTSKPTNAVAETAFLILCLDNGRWGNAFNFLKEKSMSREERSLAARRGPEASPASHDVDELVASSRPLRPPRSWLSHVQCIWDKSTRLTREAALTSESRTTQCRLLRAKAYVDGMALGNWVAEQNSKALAPSGPSVLDAHSSLAVSLPGAPLPATTGGARAGRRVGKNWLQRWTRRHKLERGLFRFGSSLTQAEMRTKALLAAVLGNGCFCTLSVHIAKTRRVAHFRGPDFTTVLRSQKWDPLVGRYKKRDQKTVAKQGPFFISFSSDGCVD